MNRLVLIGNGFDLAHGLKTSYKDFITDYLYKAITQFYTRNKYEDELIKIFYHSSGMALYNNSIEYDYTYLLNQIKYINNQNNGAKSEFKFKSIFFKNILNICSDANWVDIENEYFHFLKLCKTPAGWMDENVKQLNNEFNYIKTKLDEYLSNISTSIDRRSYTNLLCAPIEREEILLQDGITDFTLKDLYILNFNYTSTFETYYHSCRRIVQNIHVNFIHGELNNLENPIVFGFGDEHDKLYKEFEDYNKNMLFRHIKSFAYFKTPNYHNLVRFTDKEPFQVLIVGHSCGLSDRTMLKQIFEHENCKSIKILHYCRPDGSNDYTDKTYDIARHFTDKGMMRKKIISFNHLDCMVIY